MAFAIRALVAVTFAIVGCGTGQKVAQLPAGVGVCRVERCPPESTPLKTPWGLTCRTKDGVPHGATLALGQNETSESAYDGTTLLWVFDSGQPVELISCNLDGSPISRTAHTSSGLDTTMRWYANGRLRMHHDPNGIHMEYYPTGKIRLFGWSQCGERAGTWRRYYVDGTLESEGSYAAPRCSGPPNEHEFSIPPTLRSGRRSGVWRHYYPTGSPCLVETFQDARRVGQWRLHWPTGALRLRGSLSPTAPDGEWMELDLHGNVVRTIDCRRSCEFPEAYMDLLDSGASELCAAGGVRTADDVTREAPNGKR